MTPIALNMKNFEQEALKAKETVLIDFWASWCGPCRMLSPVIDEIAEENHPNLKVCKVNIDEESELAQQFRVMSIPTLVVLKAGKVAATTVGVQPKQAILKMVEQA